MRSNRCKRVGALLTSAGLLMFSGTLEAGHESTTGSGVELLHSSSKSGIRLKTEADVLIGTCPGPVATMASVVPPKSLFVTNVSVVDDCYRTTWDGACPGTQLPATRGAWTFGRVMEGVFGTTDPQKLSNRVRQWLNLWMEDQIVNGEHVGARPQMRDQVLRPWQEASGGNGSFLDMKKAPFRLLAIINQQFVSTDFKNAGELRIIYNVLDPSGNPSDFNVILEFQIPGGTCANTLDFTNAFHELSSTPFGPEFNAKLQAITDRVIALNASPNRLNGSSLLRLRTNENVLGDPWELREFALGREDNDGGTKNAKLVHDALDQTPAAHFQGTQTLADFIIENAANITSTEEVRLHPPTYRGEPFLAGVAQNDGTLGWIGPDPKCTSTPRVPRRTFSFKTCQGCHGKDTATNFVHITGRQIGQEAEISKFLKGPLYRTPDDCGTVVNSFELFFRQFHQCVILNSVCPAETP